METLPSYTSVPWNRKLYNVMKGGVLAQNPETSPKQVMASQEALQVRITVCLTRCLFSDLSWGNEVR